MHIEQGPAFAVLSGRIPLEAYEQAQRALTYTETEYRPVPGQRPRVDSRPVSLWRAIAGQLVFPSGLTARVVKALGTVEVRTTYPALTPSRAPSPLPNGTVLFPEQVAAIEEAIAAQRGLMPLAPNFGKTETLAGIMTAFPTKRALVLIKSKRLVHETGTRLADLLQESVDKLGGGYPVRPRGARISVASVLALNRCREPWLAEWLGSRDLLLVDEAHGISHQAWLRTLGGCTAPLRLGLSGTVAEARTPLVMEAFLGPPLTAVTDPELVALGRSAQAYVYMPYSGTMIRDGASYEEQYEAVIVRNPLRNQMLADLTGAAVQSGLRALVLVYRVDHGRTMEALLGGAGLRTEWVWGGSGEARVEAALAALQAGRLDVVVGSTILNEGVNLPAVGCLTNAAGWRSRRATAQKAGRVLRRKVDGPNICRILDPYDLGAPIMKRHSEERRKTYLRRGFKVTVGPAEGFLSTIRRQPVHDVMASGELERANAMVSFAPQS